MPSSNREIITMPLIRLDIPEGMDRDTRLRIRRRISECVARTWFKEHIWIALHEMVVERGERTVIMTIEVRPGRGQEAERTRALFTLAQEVMADEIGTTPEEMILLVREFPQHLCISGGDQLPDLDTATPDLSMIQRQAATA
jgi:hypothetical protein